MVAVVMVVRDAPLAISGIAAPPPPPPSPAAAAAAAAAAAVAAAAAAAAAVAAAAALSTDEKLSHSVPRHATTQRQLQVRIL